MKARICAEKKKLLINAFVLLTVHLKTTQDYVQEAEDVLQHCSCLTKDIFAIFSDIREKPDLV